MSITYGPNSTVIVSRALLERIVIDGAVSVTQLDQLRQLLVVQPFELTVKMVRELQQVSGEGLMACKKALVASRGDMAAARDYLRCSGNISSSCVTTSQGRSAQ